ncbi:MAG: zinc-dependent metalloprotease family protein [Acidobacteriota bacterium]
MSRSHLRMCLMIALTIVCVFPTALHTFAATGDGIWTNIDDRKLKLRTAGRQRVPDRYQTYGLNKSALKELLGKAPEEFTQNGALNETILTLPMPDGSFARFSIEHSLVVEPGLLDKFPELGATYRGQGVDDPTATARLDLLPNGFHAMILSPTGTYLVDPYAVGDTNNYVSYSKDDLARISTFECAFDDQNQLDAISSPSLSDLSNFLPNEPQVTSGAQLRTYRLALAADNEYAVAVGGNTVAGTLAAQVLIMNRVNGVYERDLAIHMNIVANNNLIVYAGDNMCSGVACTAANDPYTNNNGSTMLGENQTNIDAAIGSANYDIGHVFSTGGGGVASLRVPCGGSKARGVTGLSNPVGDAFAIDYVAHEMGHEWGGNHTFNSTVSNCGGGNRAATAAYEPGSGITIMAYAGICGNQDLALHSIDTFHVKSLEEIVAYSQTSTGNTCAVTTSSGNTPPSVSVVGGPAFNIPKQTPFTLTATGSDVNGDTLTYDWQEYDLGAATTAVPNSDSVAALPIFRPYTGKSSSARTFPSPQYILNNANVPPSTFDCGRGAANLCLVGELLPSITRTMTFKVVARDNRANAGGINSAIATVNVDGNSGPFAVTAPNTNVNWAGGTHTVTWNVANTSAPPVSVSTVKISLSIDGGQTFPTVLNSGVPNNGAATVLIPSLTTSTARIKVEAVGSIFFDLSDTNFSISPGTMATTKFDFDADGKADQAVYRNGVWYALRSGGGVTIAQWGNATDTTVTADYDADGKADIAVFRDGVWYILRSSDNVVNIISWGAAGDIPVTGDFDGDRRSDITVFRNGAWFILNPANNNVRIESFGTAGDKPLTGDFDGDGKQDLVVYRSGLWLVQRSSDNAITTTSWGIPGDLPAAGDFDGDGKTDWAVYRTGTWYTLNAAQSVGIVQWGIPNDVPVVADYDGDGKDDFAVYRPSDGNWYTLQSQGGVSIVNWGLAGDKPVPAQAN